MIILEQHLWNITALHRNCSSHLNLIEKAINATHCKLFYCKFAINLVSENGGREYGW